MDYSFFFPIIFLVIIGLFVVVTALASIASNKAQKQQNKSYKSQKQIYTLGSFGNAQMELDLRLPYRRFKQIYPRSKISYTDYKRLQTSRAFRRSMSSQENKRMVR